jgi:uncharacterized protein YaaN involved in tellurite resistance
MTESLNLTPPAGALVLTPPAPVAAIPAEKATSVVPLEDEAATKLKKDAADFVSGLMAIDTKDPDFAVKISDIAKLGNAEILASSQVSNRMLERPSAALAGSKGKGKDGNVQAQVADGLAKLRFTVEDLDPSRMHGGFLGDLFGVKNKLRNYFARYQSSQAHLNGILKALDNGADGLRKDNAAIEGEKVRLWDTMGKLQQKVSLVEALDAELDARIEELRLTNPERATALTSDVLFEVRRKKQDLLTQQTVAAQGYMALDLVRNNNIELLKGVDRASTTTVAALRTAVIVAEALTSQKMVLDQITALNSTTESMILATSVMLKDQTAQIHQQAASSTISIETLQTAFQNIYDTIDAVETYKVEAVKSMQTTVDALQDQLGKAGSYLERSRAIEGQRQIGANA